MATQTIDKAMIEAYFDQLLVEKRVYFKELVREIIEEKLINLKSNKETTEQVSTTQGLAIASVEETTDVEKTSDKDSFARENLMLHFDKILKEDHNLLLRLAQ
jgi:hypothetical protein